MKKIKDLKELTYPQFKKYVETEYVDPTTSDDTKIYFKKEGVLYRNGEVHEGTYYTYKNENWPSKVVGVFVHNAMNEDGKPTINVIAVGKTREQAKSRVIYRSRTSRNKAEGCDSKTKDKKKDEIAKYTMSSVRNGIKESILKEINEAKNSKRVEAFNDIIKNHQHTEVEGMDVDVQSASFYVQIWTALGKDNRKNLDNMPIFNAFDVVMKLVGKLR